MDPADGELIMALLGLSVVQPCASLSLTCRTLKLITTDQGFFLVSILLVLAPTLMVDFKLFILL